jgi:hypothetical protein
MSCGGGHLGFPIGIKNTHHVEDLPMQLNPNCPGMVIGRSSTKFLFFYADRKFKMATTAGHRLTLDPMGKCSNAFFSETANMIKAKLYMNVLIIPGQFGFNCPSGFREEAF